MKITVFTLPDCAPCSQVKADLNTLGLEFEEVPARENRERWESVVARFPSDRKTGLPCTLIEDGDRTNFIVGWYTGYKDAVKRMTNGE
ncbi:hypothetical protein TIN4_23 [Tsukamurella phage TIN4]|uniref:Glutaredoxin domain-containing protein n=2 Tax=Tinduovirus TIN3 TaxID=1982571 RepID=A0A0K0N5Y9_9CAUD|nr:hypothetical protein AVT54_gp102 [Tsukamurella phage TIN3]YP_009604153.1 hypothetical protein FDH87_gp102 [Tsukamurella phage TIN4]AKJ71820.1 hypothetical protein TIN3_23 [Tsukamurella phage TIN3]AKJ71929.1 hypothetical protein TIN4_23 [Tsukamurella phage TIN4]